MKKTGNPVILSGAMNPRILALDTTTEILLPRCGIRMTGMAEKVRPLADIANDATSDVMKGAARFE
jgi:hypothetical protein